MIIRLVCRSLIIALYATAGFVGAVIAEPPTTTTQFAWQLDTPSDAAYRTTGAASASVETWVPTMREVHARFSGRPGTFAQFGDSISVSMAFWTPLGYEPQEMSDALKADWKLVKEYQTPECWREWKGPEYGNEGQMTIRWAYENVDGWLEKLNPEVAVMLFGSNDLTEMDREEYTRRTRAVVDRCLKNGTVVILTTIPPRGGLEGQARDFAQAVRQVAMELRVPLVDYHAEILRRRPEDWNGSLERFQNMPGDTYNVPTLIARDGLHPSNPADFQQFSEAGLNHNGYLLRNAMTLRIYAAVIRSVLEDPR